MTFGEEHHVGGRDLTEWRTRVGQLLAAYGTRLATALGPHVALVVTLALSAVLVTALTAASAEIYEQVEDGDGVAGFDRPLLQVIAALRTPDWNGLVTAYTDLGGPVGMPVLATLAILAMTLAWRQWTPLVLMLAATAGSLAMTVAGKAVVGRTRPPRGLAVPPFENSASFPSGHSLNAVVVAGVLAYLLVREQHTAWARATTLAGAVLFAVTMGLSRVYLGHHWLTDVLVAWTLGLAWLLLVVVAHRLFLTARRGRKPVGGSAAPS
jgi:membrane-associated phospholipid phosphatase